MGSNARERQRQKTGFIFLAGGIFVLLGAWLYLASRVEEGKYLRGRFISGEKSTLFQFELALSPGERQKGLMFRKAADFPLDRAMIFIFPKEEVHSFYMKNTLIPLDMVFVNKDMSVVGVLENVPIMNEESRKVEGPSLYVVELNAGAAKRSGIGAGSHLQIDAPLPKAVL